MLLLFELFVFILFTVTKKEESIYNPKSPYLVLSPPFCMWPHRVGCPVSFGDGGAEVIWAAKRPAKQYFQMQR